MYKKEAEKIYFVNPEKLSIYKNGSIRFGDFMIYRRGSMYVLSFDYDNELYSSSHIPWGLDTFFGDTILKVQLKIDTVSETPYDGVQIKISDQNCQFIQINDLKIKVAYADSDHIHKLMKDEKVIKESKNLKQLFKEAKSWTA